MKGVWGIVGDFFLLVLGIVAVVLSLTWIAHGTPIAQRECISTQSGEISDLKFKLEEVTKRGGAITYSFDVLNCAKCVWYNEEDEHLVVVYSVRRGFLTPEELMVKTYNISTHFVDIGCNCDSCDEGKDDVYCANLRSGENSPYSFEVKKNRVTCVDCPPTSKPCTPCSDYTDDGKDECEKWGCYWCEECFIKMSASPEKVNTCVDNQLQCGYLCRVGVCDAECLPCPEDQECISGHCFCKSPPPPHI